MRVLVLVFLLVGGCAADAGSPEVNGATADGGSFGETVTPADPDAGPELEPEPLPPQPQAGVGGAPPPEDAGPPWWPIEDSGNPRPHDAGEDSRPHDAQGDDAADASTDAGHQVDAADASTDAGGDEDAVTDAGNGDDAATDAGGGEDAATDAAVDPCEGVTCDDGNECTADVCEDGGCLYPKMLDYTGCVEGQCFDGTCEPVGGQDQRCRSGSSCDGDLVCHDGFCRECGGWDQPCCLWPQCNGGIYLKCYEGMCRCGQAGQVCCLNPVTMKRYCEGDLTCLYSSTICH
jgi:hypothetical protein